MTISPAPNVRLARLDPDDAEALRGWARALRLGAWRAAARDAEQWLGAPIFIAPEAPSVDRSGPPTIATDPTVLLEGPHRAALTLPANVASVLVERTLGGEADLQPAGPFGEVELGVLQYAVARWLGDADAGYRAVVALAHPAGGLAYIGGPPVVSWPFRISLSSASGQGRLLLPRAPDSPPPPRPGRAPRELAGLPVEVAIVVGAAALRRDELDALEPSDVVVPDELDLDEVWLGPPGGGDGFAATTEPGGLRVARLASRPRLGHANLMNEEASDADLERDPEGLDALPVTLSLELGRFHLPLGELRQIAPGDVVRTDLPARARVELRAGQRIAARGELIEIDGELGVRILEVCDLEG